MDNAGVLVTLGTQDTGRRKTKTKSKHNTENYKDEQHGHHQNEG